MVYGISFPGSVLRGSGWLLHSGGQNISRFYSVVLPVLTSKDFFPHRIFNLAEACKSIAFSNSSIKNIGMDISLYSVGDARAMPLYFLMPLYRVPKIELSSGGSNRLSGTS